MQQDIIQRVLRTTMQALVKPILTPALPVSVQRTLIRQAYRASTPPRRTSFSSGSIQGIPYHQVTCNPNGRRAILYLHGGAYIIGSSETHRGITGHIAKATGCALFVPDYRLAPEHPYPAALDDALAMYQHLLALDYSPEEISVIGDSAGGGLAIALALRLKAEQLPLPSSLVVMSPWVDLTHQQLHVPDAEPVLQLRWIQNAAKLYSNGMPLTDPLISPVYGDLAGLPPILIQVGSQEILLNDARRLAEKAKADGVSVTLTEHHKLWHVFQIHAGALAEANHAINAIARHIEEHAPS
ncbi:alpha/beta hydrolase [Marinobacter sp. 1Y8]